jgi:cytidylate kinase
MVTGYNKYIDVSKSYLYSQLNLDKDNAKGIEKKIIHLPFITISRETGARGTTIGKALAEYMTHNDKPQICPWTLFDKNLVEEIFNEYTHSGIESILPERKFSDIQGLFEELFGLHPTKREMVYKIGGAIKKFARMGNVVIIGRGGAFLTRKYAYGLHIRFVGSIEKRTKVIMAKFDMVKKQAEEYIKHQDKQRIMYVKKLYGIDISDPHYYDMVINTDNFSNNDTVELLGEQLFKLKKI